MNKDDELAESAERRVQAERNSRAAPEDRTQSLSESESGLWRVREAALDRNLRFDNLLHHVTVSLLRAAYFALKRKAEPGVDGVRWADYGEGLEERLRALHARVHRGRYRPKPVRRSWIPKPDGRQRPLGVASVEDKVLQQALAWVLESVYEREFLGFSYGFRPRRGPHDALDAVYMAIQTQKVSWVLDADIEGFFDHVDHGWLMRFLAHRIADRRVLRLIEQTLEAGVVDDGEWQATQKGVPQGAVISPLLANVYLHYALDQWVHAWRQKRARGAVSVVRYADDFVVGLQYEDDGVRLRAALSERLARFGLKLHSGKTRLIEFGRFARINRERRGRSKPETFDFLGFTHVCAEGRKGQFYLLRQSRADRQRAKLRAIKARLRVLANIPERQQGRWLRRVVQGYFQYHAVPGNYAALDAFRTEVNRLWLRALRRRSQRHRLPWARMSRLIRRYIPSVRILHPYPGDRFAF